MGNSFDNTSGPDGADAARATPSDGQIFADAVADSRASGRGVGAQVLSGLGRLFDGIKSKFSRSEEDQSGQIDRFDEVRAIAGNMGRLLEKAKETNRPSSDVILWGAIVDPTTYGADVRFPKFKVEITALPAEQQDAPGSILFIASPRTLDGSRLSNSGGARYSDIPFMTTINRRGEHLLAGVFRGTRDQTAEALEGQSREVKMLFGALETSRIVNKS